MDIKWLIKTAMPAAIFCRKHRKQGIAFARMLGQQRQEEDVLLLTVAFENEELIAQQIAYIAQNCRDRFLHIIADNSRDQNARRKIRKAVEEQRDERFVYFPLPENPFTSRKGGSSSSHGAALNWIYRNMVCSMSRIECFLTLDHDLWPFQSFSVKEMLETQKFYGLRQERALRWYLWPGFSAFINGGQHMNFLPCPGLDTGGSNYALLYKDEALGGLKFAEEKHIDIYDWIAQRCGGQSVLNEVRRTT